MTQTRPLPIALAHRMRGRSRLHLEPAEGEERSAERVITALGEHPAVRELRESTRARSLLVLHHGEIEAILGDLQARGLVTVQVRPRSESELSMRSLKRAIDRADATLLEHSEGGVGLAGIAFVALSAAGVWQALNGQLLPAGTTLFSYALEAMRWGAERDQPT